MMIHTLKLKTGFNRYIVECKFIFVLTDEVIKYDLIDT